MSEHEQEGARLSRRDVLRFFAGTGVLLAAGEGISFGAEAAAAVTGYGTDPDLTKIYQPGDVWPLTMSPAQKKAATALADVLLPADGLGPAASALRVPDYIDEWVSAPYPGQQAVRPVIMEGLDWIDAESRKRHQKPFAELEAAQQTGLCDAICGTQKGKKDLKQYEDFFRKFRALAMGAYYATPEGWKAIGYVGNIPLPTFDGPPPEVLKRLGVEQ